MFVNVTGDRRVSNVKINGKDLELDKKYNASFIEFIANGGDGYSMFAKYEVTNEPLVTDTDALVSYIQNDLNGTIPEKYKDYQGRINFKNQTVLTIPIPTSEEEEEETNIPTTNTSNQGSFKYFHTKKSDRGLSTGGIIAIIVAIAVALGIAGAVFFACRDPNPPKKVDYYNSSIDQMNYPKNI